jgi:hypothetical protein
VTLGPRRAQGRQRRIGIEEFLHAQQRYRARRFEGVADQVQQRLPVGAHVVGEFAHVAQHVELRQRAARAHDRFEQRAGSASRIEADRLRAEFGRNPTLQRVLYRYTDALLAQAIQIAVCSRYHVLEARLARSLLITRDRLQSEKFHLTHEFLAHALGVRRVGVTKAASALQNQKLITYSRGNIEILDSTGLEAVSCRCYELVKENGAIGMGTVFV